MGSDNRKGVLYAVATASLWGFMAIIIKVIVRDISPVAVVWFRFSMAFVVLSAWTLVFKKGDFRIFRRPPILLILAAIFLGFNYMGFIGGLKHISPSSAQVFIQIAPVTFALSGIVIFREQVNWKHIVGFILVVSGIGLFYSEQLREMASFQGNVTLGTLMVLGSGLSWATFAALQKSLVKKVPTNQLNLFIYAFCAVLLTPFLKFSSLKDLDTVYWMLLMYLGLNTVLAYGALALAIKLTEAARVSVIITLNPIITFVTMALLGRMEVTWIETEAFSVYSVLGALTVLSGAVLVISTGWKKKTPEHALDG